MYSVRKSIDIDFAHHVSGHLGPCINIHGHTWKFEVELEAQELDDQGFVVDFGLLKKKILTPIHAMLDHGLAFGSQFLFSNTQGREYPMLRALQTLNQRLLLTRETVHGQEKADTGSNRWLFEKKLHWKHNGDYEIVGSGNMYGAFDLNIGGAKIIIFGFIPTSERLAHWLFQAANEVIADSPDASRVAVRAAHVYETLHPVESVASYYAD